MYREGLRGVNLCFSTTDGTFSWLLRKAMKIPASHCVITFRRVTLDKVMVMDAQGRGCILVPWSKWKLHNQLLARYSLRLPDSNIQNGLEKLGAQLSGLRVVDQLELGVQVQVRLTGPGRVHVEPAVDLAAERPAL